MPFHAARPLAFSALAIPVALALGALTGLGGCSVAPHGSDPQTTPLRTAGLQHAFLASPKLAPRGARARIGPELFPSSTAPDSPGFDLLAATQTGPCPAEMALVDGKFCVDRWEASLVQILPSGDERDWSPFDVVPDGATVRAVSRAGVAPQGYVSEVQAKRACERSGKRLCKATEWRTACMGPQRSVWGYGSEHVAGRCNDHGRSPMGAMLGRGALDAKKWTAQKMNSPEANQVPGTLARTGEHAECTNGYGVFDMVGNLHEWVDDPAGTFQGGYYLDTHVNGDGCTYRTVAHDAVYHDYSTGFRCCADPE
jgi:hypothetical protein